MSVTTTANPVTTSVLRVLEDYEVHHAQPSSDNNRADELSARPNQADTLRINNPENWPTQYRNIPDRRPINYNLDRSIRPGGANVPEQIFILTMLTGCRINANMASIWRATGGKLNKHIFHYEIGGEW